ncbi:MAG: alpha-ketoacid dehydrogenase subunit beta, partial [Bacillales bacterium]
MAQMTMIQAITDAMRVELKRDEKVLIFGEDVGKNGGVFRATEGL